MFSAPSLVHSLRVSRRPVKAILLMETINTRASPSSLTLTTLIVSLRKRRLHSRPLLRLVLNKWASRLPQLLPQVAYKTSLSTSRNNIWTPTPSSTDVRMIRKLKSSNTASSSRQVGPKVACKILSQKCPKKYAMTQPSNLPKRSSSKMMCLTRQVNSMLLLASSSMLVVLQDQSLLKTLSVESSRMSKTVSSLPIWRESATVETRPGSLARRLK